MKIRQITSSLVLLAFVSCGYFPPATNGQLENKQMMPEEDMSLVERGSYSTLLMNFVSIDSLVFIGNKTIKLDHLAVLEKLPYVNEETKNDFVQKNKNSKRIEGGFDVYAKVRLIEIENNEVLGTLGRLKKEYSEFDGIILLSRVGLNNNGDEALIYMEKYGLDGISKKQICFISSDDGKGVKVSCLDSDVQY